MTDIGLVLAAGGGSRFGQPKAPVVVENERLVDRAVRVLNEGGCDEVVVVLGAWVGVVPTAEVVVNADWESGMGSSLQAGLRHIQTSPGVDRAVVTLVDLPGMTPEAVRAVREPGARLAIATYGGRPGHPVILGREHWEAIVGLPLGDEGVRTYLSARDDVDRVEVGELADCDDVDYPIQQNRSDGVV